MNTSRFTTVRDRRMLKIATRAVVDTVGVEACALSTRGSANSMSRFGNLGDDHADTFITIDRVADLERLTGCPAITAELARMTGHTLVPLPDAGASAPDVAMMGTIAKEGGDVLSAMAQALADGTITPAEAKEIHKEAWEQVTHLTALCQGLQQIAEDE